MLNDHTSLPTVLQELIVQYLLPTGYTIVYDGSGFGCAGSRDSGSLTRIKYLFVPYKTSEPSVQLPHHELSSSHDVRQIIPYKESVLVYSDDQSCRMSIHLHTPGQHQTTCLLKRYGDHWMIHRMCVFDDYLILQTKSTSSVHGVAGVVATTTFNIIDLKTGLIRWNCEPQTRREVFVPLSNKRLLCFKEAQVLEFAVSDSKGISDARGGIQSVIEGLPSKVLELKIELDPDVLERHFVVNDEDICFISYHATPTIWLLSSTTWKCTELCRLPSGYTLLRCSVNGQLVAVNIGGADPVLRYCVETQSWVKTDFPLVTLHPSAVHHIACM